MWWLPLLAALVLAIMLAIAQLATRTQHTDRAKMYRHQYSLLIRQTDAVTTALNKLAAQVPQQRDPKILDYYESCLKMLETLLLALTKIPPFGTEVPTLKSALFLVNECQTRTQRVERAFSEHREGRHVSFEDLHALPKIRELLPEGCYFCSKPPKEAKLTRVRVKVETEVKQVDACDVCAEQLRKTKKVKVLFFMKDGKAKHWSDVSEYRPSQDYFNLNSPENALNKRKLELVYSRRDQGAE